VVKVEVKKTNTSKLISRRFMNRPSRLQHRAQGQIQKVELGGGARKGSGGWKFPSGVQGQSAGRGPEGWSPPEAGAFL